MKHLLLGILCLGFVACTCVTGPKPTPVEPTDTDKCAAACARLVELGCEEGQPLEDGTTCAKFCVDTQESGHALNPTCVVGLQACGQLGTCQVNRKGGR